MASPPTAGSLPSNAPSRRGWTREEFQRADDLGLFGPEERLELIHGEIYEKVTQNSTGALAHLRHATGVLLSEEAARRVFGAGYSVRGQLPLALGGRGQPEPDIAVVTGSARDYAHAHPTGAVLVIEVSDTTLDFDRTTKAAAYAQAGIADYWIVNLTERILEVYRQPTAMPGQPLGFHYRSILRLAEGEAVAPLAAPGTTIAVADLLP